MAPIPSTPKTPFERYKALDVERRKLETKGKFDEATDILDEMTEIWLQLDPVEQAKAKRPGLK